MERWEVHVQRKTALSKAGVEPSIKITCLKMFFKLVQQIVMTVATNLSVKDDHNVNETLEKLGLCFNSP